MHINFTKLQKAFIDKIRKESQLILRGQDVSFKIQTNYEFEQYNTNIKILVFDEEFSMGYPNSKTTEEALILDCFSRLHDYNTDNAKWHIIGLKILELEKRYLAPIQQLREQLIGLNSINEPDDLVIEISDIAPSETDKRGFPKFEISVMIQGQIVARKELDFDGYNFQLMQELKESIPIS